MPSDVSIPHCRRYCSAQSISLCCVKLAFHGADTDTDSDTDTDTDFLARKSRVSDVRMYKRVGRVGVRVGVGVVAVECELNVYRQQYHAVFARMRNYFCTKKATTFANCRCLIVANML